MNSFRASPGSRAAFYYPYIVQCLIQYCHASCLAFPFMEMDYTIVQIIASARCAVSSWHNRTESIVTLGHAILCCKFSGQLLTGFISKTKPHSLQWPEYVSHENSNVWIRPVFWSGHSWNTRRTSSVSAWNCKLYAMTRWVIGGQWG
jgi:hypothetical protein